MINELIEKSKSISNKIAAIDKSSTDYPHEIVEAFDELIENDRIVHELLLNEIPKKYPITVAFTINNAGYINDWFRQNNINKVVSTITLKYKTKMLTLWFDDKDTALKFKLQFT